MNNGCRCRRDVEDSHPAVAGACGDALAVGRNRQTAYQRDLQLKLSQLRAGNNVPENHLSILSDRNQLFSARHKTNKANTGAVTYQSDCRFFRRSHWIPEHDQPIQAGRYQAFAIGRKSDRCDNVGMAVHLRFETGAQPAKTPDSQSVAFAGRGQQATIG